jgi:hypothetical protein
VVVTTFDAELLEDFSTGLRRLAEDGAVVLGGGRAPEVRLEADDGVVEVWVTPSGDDPWPVLRWLIWPD